MLLCIFLLFFSIHTNPLSLSLCENNTGFGSKRFWGCEEERKNGWDREPPSTATSSGTSTRATTAKSCTFKGSHLATSWTAPSASLLHPLQPFMALVPFSLYFSLSLILSIYIPVCVVVSLCLVNATQQEKYTPNLWQKL